MELEEIAIRVNEVSKDFKLSQDKTDSLKSAFVGMFEKNQKKNHTLHALKDVSFEINKGEFFGIVGRNGSGKSTLLKILANIYQPTNGKVFTKGKLVPFIELGVGFNPELTGKENIYLNGAMLGFSVKEIHAMYEDIVSFAELEKFMDQKLKNYSSGMQVRLAFSMATRSKADILLIDEVLAVGDADFKRKCYDYFKSLKKNKKTVIFVSHDMDAIKEFCDRAALIEGGILKSLDTPKKISDQYAELFLVDNGKENVNKAKIDNHKGSGEVKIVSTKLNKGIFTDKDETLIITSVIEGVDKTSQLMSGFAVKNAAGQFINSASTWEKHNTLADLDPGEKCTVIWECPNIYEDGLYTLDIYCLGSNLVVYDRVDDAISFRVKRPNRSGCLVNLPVPFKIQLKNNIHD